MVLDDLLRERRTIPLSEHPRATQMSVLAQCGRQPERQRDVAKPSALRGRDVSFPVGPLHAELPFAEIDITPFERHDLAAPQPGLSAKQHDEVRAPLCRVRGCNQPLVLVEVITTPGLEDRSTELLKRVDSSSSMTLCVGTVAGR